jgi:hypothetical protein
MADRRESILSRLRVICGDIQGVNSVERNRLDVVRLNRPAIVILDGAEQVLDPRISGRGDMGNRSEVQRMELAPLISIHVRGTHDIDGGNLLSLFRTRVLAAILTDPPLADFIAGAGSIRYEGAIVAPPTAEGNEYRMDLSLVFTYPFKLADITT